jgi:CRP-like cAMP-binding protein
LSVPFPKARENVLLAHLPRAELQRLQAQLELVSLQFRAVLYEPGETIHHVYFPLSGVVSMLAIMADGQGIELVTLGCEGLVGLPALLGAVITPFRFLVQVPGEALRLDARLLQAESQRLGPLHQVLCRYANAFLLQLGQAAACNGLHTVRQRCCRWLLMTHDRVRADAFPLTQDFLAQMLGVRRASVADVARMLQRDGLIEYHRGTLTILDRAGLEKASCECYRFVQREFSRLFGDT